MSGRFSVVVRVKGPSVLCRIMVVVRVQGPNLEYTNCVRKVDGSVECLSVEPTNYGRSVTNNWGIPGPMEQRKSVRLVQGPRAHKLCLVGSSTVSDI